MNKNITYAFRNILKNKVNSVITITGLSVAFACLLLIFLYVTQELCYNNFHVNADNIYRVNYSVKWTNGTENESTLLNPDLSQVMKEEVPGIRHSTAFRSAQKQTMSFEHQKLEETLCLTEPDFFKMFSFRVLYGDPDRFLKNPDEVVITENLAEKLSSIDNCNVEELLGKTVSFMSSGDQLFVISGILKNLPKNSTLQFNALISYKYDPKFSRSNNILGNSSIFYQTIGSENIATTEAQISSVIKTYYQDLIERLVNNKALSGSEAFQPFMISLKNTHLDKVQSDYETNNNKTSLYILSVVGLLILIIACINFVMLSLGQAFKKAGEVGIRNTLGARKTNIFTIFFTENSILAFVAFVLGAVLCILFLPTFKDLAPGEIYTSLINIPKVMLFVVGCLLLIAFSTSILPVLKLVNIQPNLLSSKKLRLGKSSGATRLFVVLQYGLSILLIILTISVVRQINYMKYKDLGFSTKNIMDLRIYHLTKNEKLTLRERLKSNPAIVNLTVTDRNYTGGRSSNAVIKDNGDWVDTRILNVDNDYIPTLGLKLIEGENFRESNANDKLAIVNEKLLAALDKKENPIGNTINMSGTRYQIIGVVKDFHYDSMAEGIMPLILRQPTSNGYRGNFMLLKYQPQQLASLLPYIRKTWKEIIPEKELDLKFWDDQLNNRYQSEEQWSQIIGYTAIIAIIISSLGLFGLTLLTVNTRKKEIGIRKINGAKIGEVMAMLNRDFVKWVLVAFIIASPISWYAANQWLENFAYKTTLSWWIFALAGALALGIALLTVSWQSWKAATRNPVEALSYE
ncbi:ABC transporter permease [Saccharicrinis sp. FJH62]|uniref:ABC transporter permease n=1 Tax=Saccharicrinis sp. FJH62 TaxID=3344657 RepID=UPI0035D4169F